MPASVGQTLLSVLHMLVKAAFILDPFSLVSRTFGLVPIDDAPDLAWIYCGFAWIRCRLARIRSGLDWIRPGFAWIDLNVRIHSSWIRIHSFWSRVHSLWTSNALCLVSKDDSRYRASIRSGFARIHFGLACIGALSREMTVVISRTFDLDSRTVTCPVHDCEEFVSEAGRPIESRASPDRVNNIATPTASLDSTSGSVPSDNPGMRCKTTVFAFHCDCLTSANCRLRRPQPRART